MTGWLGLDPGEKGGLALQLEDPTRVLGPNVETYGMPSTERDLLLLLSEIRKRGDVFAFLERAQAYPPHGPPCRTCKRRPTQGIAAGFKYGQNYGALRVALLAAGIPFETIMPGVWQRALKIPARGKSTKTQHKNVLKRRAQELFPLQTVTLATADALLISEHCRRTHV